MGVSLETKVDLLLKKLAGVSKTDTAGLKSVNNESIPSPTLNRGDRIWLNSYLIPPTASSTLGTVDSYFQNKRVQCVEDNTSQKINGVYPTWKTMLTDWIPPEFDNFNLTNTYRVKVYYGLPGIPDPSALNSGAEQIFADGNFGSGEWNFDYQSGILNFYGDNPIPNGMNSTHVIYVLGFRYVGPTGFNSVFKVDTPIMRGDLLLPTLITLRGDTVVEKNVVIKEDLEVQGGDITTNKTVFNLLNSTATTVNFAGAATILNVGASTGTTTIKNNATIEGTDLKTTKTTFNLLPDTATTVNLATAATNLVVGAITGTTRVRNDLDVDGNLNVDGSFHIGQNLDVDGDLNIDGGDLTVSTQVFNIANTTATTINLGGAATRVEIGASSGTTNINNNLEVDGDVVIDGEDLKASTATFNLLNETTTSVNFAGAATNIEIGSNTGNTNVNNNLNVDKNVNVAQNLDVDGNVNVDANIHVGQNLDVDGDVNIDGGDLTVSTETFNLANNVAKNVNFAGAATNIEIGSQEGLTNVNNNLKVDGETTFGNKLTVDGIVDVNNSLYVEGQARVNQSLEVEDSVKVQNELAVEGGTQITKDLNVGGYIKAGKLVDTMIDCGEY